MRSATRCHGPVASGRHQSMLPSTIGVCHISDSLRLGRLKIETRVAPRLGSGFIFTPTVFCASNPVTISSLQVSAHSVWGLDKALPPGARKTLPPGWMTESPILHFSSARPFRLALLSVSPPRSQAIPSSLPGLRPAEPLLSRPQTSIPQ